MTHLLSRFGAASGAVFVAAVVLGSVLNAVGADTGDHGAVSVAGYQRDLTTTNQIGWSLIVLGVVALVVFLGYLHRWLRRFETAEDWLATAALSAGLLYLALVLGEFVTVIADRNPGDRLTTEIASTLLDLDEAAFAVSGLMFGVFVLLTAVHCAVYRALPRWLAAVGICLGALTAVAGGAAVPTMGTYLPAPYVAALAWTFTISVLIAVRTGDPTAAAPKDPTRVSPGATAPRTGRWTEARG